MRGRVMHTPVRYRPEGFEMRCSLCRTWLPLTLDLWVPKNGMARCRACWAAYHRAHEAGRRSVDAIADAKREASRMHYRANRERNLAAMARWRDANRDRIREYNAMYRRKHREKLREQNAAYYEEARDVILMKKRLAYRERVA